MARWIPDPQPDGFIAMRIIAYDVCSPAKTESEHMTDYADEIGIDLAHPDIKSARLTCAACPEQWEGELHDGRAFYFRYRCGRATLAVGADRRSVAGVTMPGQVPGTDVSIAQVGEPLHGMFDDDEQRTEVFGRLLGWLHDESPQGSEPGADARAVPAVPDARD